MKKYPIDLILIEFFQQDDNNPAKMSKYRRKLTYQEKQIVRFMFFLAGIGLFFSLLLPYLF